MKHEQYPALFRSADTASNKYQRNYLNLIKAEYFLLFVASVLSLSVFASSIVYAIATVVLGMSAAVLLTRAVGKPEQDWYKCRALAESVKTLTWRYSMCAFPFGEGDQINARNEFRENLEKTFKSNSDAATKIAEDWSAENQITAEMTRLRALPLSDRKAFYQIHRINEQREWYSRKAAWNRKMSRRWVTVSVISYIAAAGFSVARIVHPEINLWPIDPLIVVATSIVGWLQIKKFNELAAAYSVTSQEIGLINITLEHSEDVNSFSDFVIEAETAFSREHTLWIARQAN
ncbi:DUF4231 domain-containing protein [Rhizobium ruizarguesonis]|uniref:DUF4231 domain-containing protein n=1 Tax=Rhizobium ruizarguesonis TaxID=2081791 RepID=UPI00103212E0|nr:DUF4231 domain-containing protein [Rhizobium ruizarguesonis]TBA48915.1 DUF4231 domain-containing protein [Rhizobium ruizarguesonis]TBB02857.1 DUF4231 domain-containing protein [Rhizobium ruizarguesonis]